MEELLWVPVPLYVGTSVHVHTNTGAGGDGERNQKQRFSQACTWHLLPFPASNISVPAQRPPILPRAPQWTQEAWGRSVPWPETAELPRTLWFCSHLIPVRHFQSCLWRGLDSDHCLLLKVANSSDVLVSHIGQCRGRGVKRSDWSKFKACQAGIQLTSPEPQKISSSLLT